MKGTCYTLKTKAAVKLHHATQVSDARNSLDSLHVWFWINFWSLCIQSLLLLPIYSYPLLVTWLISGCDLMFKKVGHREPCLLQTHFLTTNLGKLWTSLSLRILIAQNKAGNSSYITENQMIELCRLHKFYFFKMRIIALKLKLNFFDNFTHKWNVFWSYLPLFLLSSSLPLFWNLSSSEHTLLPLFLFLCICSERVCWGCLYEHVHEVVCWSMGNLPVATPLKRNYFLSPSNSEPRGGISWAPPQSIIEFVEPCLWRSFAGKYSCFVFIQIMVMSCPINCLVSNNQLRGWILFAKTWSIAQAYY